MQAKLPGTIPAGALSLTALVVLGWASYSTLRLGLADHYYRANTLRDVTRAVELDPGNSGAWLWLAEHQERAGLDPAAALRKAAALSPLNSAPPIRLGLRAELEGNPAEAERWLLEAARIDRLFQPRWSLVNFYFRARNRREFWKWVRAAMEMSYGDMSPLYSLCWRVSDDPAFILDAIPERRSVLAGYLGFLLASERWAAAAAAARRLSGLATGEEMPVLLASLDRSPELETWNALCRRGVVPYSPLDPDRGPLLTNANFRSAPLLHGFDWRVMSTAEVTASRTKPDGLRIELSGNQPEACELLWQPVPAKAGRRYRFRFAYQTSGIADKTGLRWVAGDVAGRDLGAGDWTDGSIEFAATSPVTKLSLAYQRVSGSTRIAGTLLLRNLSLETLP